MQAATTEATRSCHGRVPSASSRAKVLVLTCPRRGEHHGCGDDDPGPAGGTEHDAAVDTTADAPAPTTDAQGDSGGGRADVELPPIDPSVDMMNLTDAQRRQLCDWKNAQLGGYGLTTDCGGGNKAQMDENQEKCLTSGLVTRCPVTVRQFETCVLAQAPSHGCVFPFEQCRVLVCQ